MRMQADLFALNAMLFVVVYAILSVAEYLIVRLLVLLKKGFSMSTLRRRRLTNYEVERARKAYSTGMALETIASALGCTVSQARKIMRGEMYAKAPGPISR